MQPVAATLCRARSYPTSMMRTAAPVCPRRTATPRSLALVSEAPSAEGLEVSGSGSSGERRDLTTAVEPVGAYLLVKATDKVVDGGRRTHLIGGAATLVTSHAGRPSLDGAAQRVIASPSTDGTDAKGQPSEARIPTTATSAASEP